MTYSLPTDKPADVRKAILLGATGLRMDAYWTNLERTRNRYSWSSMAHLDAAAGHDLTVVLGYGNPLWGGARHIPATDLEIQAFCRYAVAVAKSYPSATLELLNEPNHATFWDNPDARAYNRLALATVQALRAAGCQNPLLAPSVARGGSFIDWQVQALGNGLLGRLDGLSCHFYDERYSPEAALFQLRREAQDVAGYLNSPVPKLVVTEIGYDRNKIQPVVPFDGSVDLIGEALPKDYRTAKVDSGQYFKGRADGLLTHVVEVYAERPALISVGIDDDRQRFHVAGPEWRTYAVTGRQGKQGRLGQVYRVAGDGWFAFRGGRTFVVEEPSPETLELMRADVQESYRKRAEGCWYTLLEAMHEGFGVAPNIASRRS